MSLINIKVKLSLYFIKHQAMKMYMGIEVWLYTSLILAVDGGEWSACCPRCFTSGGREPWYPLDRCWAGPRTGLDVVACYVIKS